jgi:hypothetical protein
MEVIAENGRPHWQMAFSTFKVSSFEIYPKKQLTGILI